MKGIQQISEFWSMNSTILKFWLYLWFDYNYNTFVWTGKMFEFKQKPQLNFIYWENVKTSLWISLCFYLITNYYRLAFMLWSMLLLFLFFLKEWSKTKTALLFFLWVMFKINSLAAVSPQGRVSTLMKTTSKGFILPSFISCPQKVWIHLK